MNDEEMSQLEKLRQIQASRCSSVGNDPGPFRESIRVDVGRLIAEIERLQAIVEGAKLSRSTWIVERGWNKETGYGYFVRLCDSIASEWAGATIEDAWAAIYKKDMAFRSNDVSCAEAGE